MCAKMVLLAILLVICGDASHGAVITEAPEDSHTLLGDKAEFNCTGQGLQLEWTYDASDITDTVLVERELTIVYHTVPDGLVSSTLYVVAKPLPTGNTDDKNTIAIGCRVASYTNNMIDIVSEGALLFVRHISTVQNLRLNISAGILHVHWDPPSFTSDDVSVDNLKYRVEIVTNINNNITVIV